MILAILSIIVGASIFEFLVVLILSDGNLDVTFSTLWEFNLTLIVCAIIFGILFVAFKLLDYGINYIF